jgi:hypothetical protein
VSPLPAAYVMGFFPFARDRQKRGKPAVGERTVSRTCMWLWPLAVEMATAISGTTPLSRLGLEKTVQVMFKWIDMYYKSFKFIKDLYTL